uniref:Probable N-acetyltransferase CML3 n=1 Tax=Acanthochromis polyacanthus TaxID=80966 RepID=A0A3Q1EB76_9TELE
MAPNFQFSIREYRPTDQHVVVSLFRDGILEHVYPAFFKAMGNPDHVGIALSICMAGYVLGGSSYFQALLFGSAWAGLIYYCCLDIYEGYMMRRLSTDMANVQASYLENPDNGFWVAEEEDAGEGGYGEMSHLIVAFPCRRKNLGSQLTRKALDFCKERGFARLLLDVSAPQTAAISLFQKFGFVQAAFHCDTHANRLESIQLTCCEGREHFGQVTSLLQGYTQRHTSTLIVIFVFLGS